MRAQTTVLSAFMATIIVIIMLFVVFVYFIPLTNTKTTVRSVKLDIERIISSRMNWTAKELAETIIADYSPEYVNITIRIYDVLNNNMIIYSDESIYEPYNVSMNRLLIYRYVITSLSRNGYYIEYIVEVGFK